MINHRKSLSHWSVSVIWQSVFFVCRSDW